jgi:hypothetical protein
MNRTWAAGACLGFACMRSTFSVVRARSRAVNLRYQRHTRRDSLRRISYTVGNAYTSSVAADLAMRLVG